MTRHHLPAMFDELFEELTPFRGVFAPWREMGRSQNLPNGGVSVYEDENTITVEAAVPGVKPEEIQVTFDRGGISIEAKACEEKEKTEKKDVKYYIRSSSSFSYWVPLPSGKIDEQSKPEAVCKDGIIKISFQKSRVCKPLKISVKGG